MVLPASQPYPRRSDRHAKVRRIVPSPLNAASSVSSRYSPGGYSNERPYRDRHCLGRVTFASNSKILRRLLQRRQNASVFAQGCADLSFGSANRPPKFARYLGWTSSSIRSDLVFGTHTSTSAAKTATRRRLTATESDMCAPLATYGDQCGLGARPRQPERSMLARTNISPPVPRPSAAPHTFARALRGTPDGCKPRWLGSAGW
jgi:hypothetical protein